MEWTDQAIVLGVRKHGETSVIAELMTRDHGRALGLVQGGRSRRMRPLLQPGNSLLATWRARLDEHLGQFRIEGDNLRAARLLDIPHAIFALQVLATHTRLLPERDSHAGLYDALLVVLDNLEQAEAAGKLLVRFELALLDELGFGLDLSRCAVTGAAGRLSHVSPKTGGAVGPETAAPYADRLLVLPPFMLAGSDGSGTVAARDIEHGLHLTGHFLQRHIYGPRAIAIPPERASLAKALARALNAPKSRQDSS